jgi:voltage-gated potassium channel
VAGYSVTTLISFIFEGQVLQLMRGRRMERKIAKLTDHYIICGCGVVGQEVAREFQQAGVPFLGAPGMTRITSNGGFNR